MSEIEIRVRPVVRYVITRYSCAPEKGAPSSCETLGEFDSEAYAEQVAEALRAGAEKPLQYAILKRNFDQETLAVYAEELEQAEMYRRQLEAEHGCEFRIYSREVTDPVAIARMAITPKGTWQPLPMPAHSES